MFGAWKETGQAGTCVGQSIPMLKSIRQVPINHRAELSALWVTPVALWAGRSVAAPGAASFTSEAPPGPPGATTGASDEIDASLPFQSDERKTQVWNLNSYTAPPVHSSAIHNGSKAEAAHVSMMEDCQNKCGVYYCSALQRQEILTHAQHGWVSLEVIMPSEIIQSQKDRC